MELTNEQLAWLAGAIALRQQAELGIIHMEKIIELETNGGLNRAPTRDDLDQLLVDLITK